MATTTGTAITVSADRLPGGLRLRRRPRHSVLWVGAGAAGVLLFGVVLALALVGAQPGLVIGTAALLVGIAAVAYRPSLGLAVLALTYPFDLVTWAGPVKLTTSAALIVLLLVIWLVRELLADRFGLGRTQLDLPAMAFALATGLSLAGMAGHLQDQLVGQLKALGGFAMFFLASRLIRNVREAWLVVGAALVAGLIQAGGLAWRVLTGAQALSDEARDHATGTLIDPNLFAGYLVLIMPLVVAAGLMFRARMAIAPAVLAALAVLVLGIALVATFSRSGWLGFVVAAVVLALLVPGARLSLAVGGAVLLATLVGFGLIGSVGGRLSPGGSDNPFDMLGNRADVWVAALGMLWDHPIFGVGVADFVNYYPQYSGESYGLNHAHDLFLNIAAERGLLGLGAFLAVLVGLLRSLRSARRAVGRSHWILATGLIASFVGYLAHSLLEVSYYDYKVLLLFWLLVGMAAAVAAWHPGGKENATRLAKPRFLK